MENEKTPPFKNRRAETVQVSIRPQLSAVEYIKSYLKATKTQIHPSTAMAQIVEAWVANKKGAEASK